MKNYDDLMVCLAAETFTDEHVGRALTENEFQQLGQLRAKYQAEMARVKSIITMIPDFDTWPLEEQVSFAANGIAFYAIQNGLDDAVLVENDTVSFSR